MLCIYIYTYLNRSIVQIIAQNDQKDMKVKTVKGIITICINLHQNSADSADSTHLH